VRHITSTKSTSISLSTVTISQSNSPHKYALVGDINGAEDKSAATEKTIQEASTYDMVLLYPRWDMYDSPVPASFVCAMLPIVAHVIHFPHETSALTNLMNIRRLS